MPQNGTSDLLDQRIGRVKTRARRRQQWLEEALARPPARSGADAHRREWIAVALDRIRRAQADVTYRARFLDAYTEHLHILEMTLLGAAEQKQSSSDGQAESAKG